MVPSRCHLRGHVVRRAAESVGAVLQLLALVLEGNGLGKAKVNDLEIAVSRDEQVLGFKVPVAVALVVDVLEGHDDDCSEVGCRHDGQAAVGA